VKYRAFDRDVSQLLSIRSAAQKQTTATHVAAADEIRWKTQTFAEMREQDFDIFFAGDAA
jgi:hypothetical protein